ncbi:MAG: ubiquinol-cytochrome c reductase iron-sulfur subunit [Anaerolineales bacterium]|jgi:Rieske Fe-S protein
MSSDEVVIDRRKFLSLATWAIGVLISAGMGIPAIAFIIGPALQSEEEQVWIRLGSVSKVALGVPTLFKTTIERKTGWIVNEEERSVYVLTEDGRDFVAMSNVCTHLGCRVRWIEDREEFFCPCHNGVFDKQGSVVDGPPPRPLDRYEVKVEDDLLYILGG